MIIVNYNLKNRLGIKLAADDGAGNGGSGSEATPVDGEVEDTTTEKIFTQADVDKLIKERIARVKKGQPSKEELEAFNAWRENQKTEEEKKNEALTNAEKAREAAEARANTLEAKVSCLSKGVLSENIDDVVILAKSIVNEEITMEQAIDKVLEKYPSFKAGPQKTEEENKGFKIGADSRKSKENIDDALSKAFGNK